MKEQRLEFENIPAYSKDNTKYLEVDMWRARVDGGWIYLNNKSGSITFVRV